MGHKGEGTAEEEDPELQDHHRHAAEPAPLRRGRGGRGGRQKRGLRGPDQAVGQAPDGELSHVRQVGPDRCRH